MLSPYVSFAAQNPQNKNFKGNVSIDVAKKDPYSAIMETSPVAIVNKDLYKKKLLSDNQAYTKYLKQLPSEQYKVYRITEKILRANNIYYQNWRIGFDLNPEEINASASSGNLVLITSGLYDSLHQNEDAIAFIISHELAHFLLKHHQIMLENSRKIQAMQVSQAVAGSLAAQNLTYSLLSGKSSLASNLTTLGCSSSALALQALINEVYRQERELEFKADSEALVLMSRTGYNPKKGLEALEFVSTLPNLYTTRSTHPSATERINSINQELTVTDKSNLINEGKANIYNSGVLNSVKSMDKKTLVIDKSLVYKHTYYKPETDLDKTLHLAHAAYKTNDMEKSIHWFYKAYQVDRKNCIPPLYLSYAWECKYWKTNNKNCLKQARKWLKIAQKNYKNDSENPYLIQQEKDIADIYLKIKSDEKQLKRIKL